MKFILIAILFFMHWFESLLYTEPHIRAIRDGNNFMKYKKYDQAETEYRRAKDLNATYAPASYNLGVKSQILKKYDEALSAYNEALKYYTSKKEKAATNHNIGNIYVDKQEWQNAIDAYKNALRNDPADMDTKYNLAYAQLKLKKEQQQKQQQQQQQNQNQDKKDSDKNQDKKDSDQDKKENKKNEDKKDNENKKEEQKPQAPKKKDDKLSKEEMQKLLNAINSQDQKANEKMKQANKSDNMFEIEKDW